MSTRLLVLLKRIDYRYVLEDNTDDNGSPPSSHLERGNQQ